MLRDGCDILDPRKKIIMVKTVNYYYAIKWTVVLSATKI